MSRGGLRPSRIHCRMTARIIASMSFMSTAPRPQRQPSWISPANGSTCQSLLSAGTTSRWPWISSAPRLGSLPSMRAMTLARPGSDSKSSGFESDVGQLLGDVLGRRALGLDRVGRVDPDQVAAEVDDLVLGGQVRLRLAHQVSSRACSDLPRSAAGRRVPSCPVHATGVRLGVGVVSCPRRVLHAGPHVRVAELADALA